jgi:hypothetical protein
MTDEQDFELTLDLQDGFRFLVDFDDDGVAPLLLDEPEPLGDGTGRIDVDVEVATRTLTMAAR